ncbi:calcium/sodium antiporter [candidate division KSB1 bacterium]|nr:calcium/sodium antiporter [candidate division KSB1 bacterium]RQW06504.1 MAG: calcium/sodium antiporter [candidate division KSB1 bacterium]
MSLFLIYIVLGLALLYFGAEGLVRGSSSLALRLRISPLVIGLTVVAFGTSMPEMVVSIKTALSQQGGIAIGNVVGSNIFNIAVILGLSSAIAPLKIRLQIIRIDTPIMFFVVFLFFLLFRDLTIDRLEGAFFLLLLIVYTYANLYFSRRAGKRANEEFSDTLGVAHYKNVFVELAFILGGLAILIGGANLLVNGAIGLSRLIGISETVIGLTIVAAGTSLPELATSVVASLRKEADIAIGNIIGSNIFNILAILGVASVVSPIYGQDIGRIDIYVMLGISLLLLPMLRSGYRLSRLEGAFLLITYGCYLYYLLTR